MNKSAEAVSVAYIGITSKQQEKHLMPGRQFSTLCLLIPKKLACSIDDVSEVAEEQGNRSAD
jgi:hypothetical protein